MKNIRSFRSIIYNLKQFEYNLCFCITHRHARDINTILSHQPDIYHSTPNIVIVYNNWQWFEFEPEDDIIKRLIVTSVYWVFSYTMNDGSAQILQRMRNLFILLTVSTSSNIEHFKNCIKKEIVILIRHWVP